MSELRIFGGSGEGNHIADVLHARDKKDKALEAQPKAAMGAGAETASVEIPPHVLHRDIARLNLSDELVVVLLAHRTSDDFANLGKEHICALNSLFRLPAAAHGLVIVYLHVGGLYLLGIMGHDDGFAEIFLHQIAFVLVGQFIALFAGELKLMAGLNGLL